MPEQALGWFLGLVMEDEPFEISLTCICIGLYNVRFLSVMLPDKPSELSHMYVCMSLLSVMLPVV